MTPTPDSLFVLDTNILVASLSARSPYRRLIDLYEDSRYRIAVNTEIVLEYEEVLLRKYPPAIVQQFMKSIDKRNNIEWIETYYKWNLIHADPDDNKFVDCAFAANARAIVSNDRHFDVLRSLVFPQISVISLTDFMELLRSEEPQ